MVHGGQCFGEMECWALQAYGAAYTLRKTNKKMLFAQNELCLILIFVFQGELLAVRIGGEYNKNINET
jgi:hypothetical protein